jgi:hypothetical protein
MKSFAEALIRDKGAETKSISAENLFPEADLAESSISLIAADAFGYDRFDQVFTAIYKLDDSEIMAFLSNRQSKEDAAKLAQAYFEFLLEFDGSEVQTEVSIEGARVVEILGTFEIIYSKGNYIGGVREAESKEHALELARRLYTKLSEVTGGS